MNQPNLKYDMDWSKPISLNFLYEPFYIIEPIKIFEAQLYKKEHFLSSLFLKKLKNIFGF